MAELKYKGKGSITGITAAIEDGNGFSNIWEGLWVRKGIIFCWIKIAVVRISLLSQYFLLPSLPTWTI